MTPHPTHVLVNVQEFRNNSYPRTWCAMLTEAGASVSPLTRVRLLAAPKGPATMLHLQWPEVTIDSASPLAHLRKTLSLARLVTRARLRGNRVLTTMHNVAPHDSDRFATAFWLFLSWVATDVHLLDEAGWPQISERYPALRRARRHEIPHLNYRDELGTPPRQDAGPAAVDDARLLYFGAIRAYKGIESLVEVVAAARDRRWRLTLHGRPQDAEVVGTIRASAQGHEHIDAALEEVDAATLEAAIRASDLVVLPYRDVLNSGSLIMALSVGTPVLVPETPTFRSLAARTGPGWITTYTGSLQASDIERALATERAPLDLSWCDRDALVPAIRLMLEPSRAGGRPLVPSAPRGLRARS